eukprot:TRINITY_DN2345_c2_g1_i2.p1 TRINITY_DN2345_c2_g1~~TRINITY_DN2345_c2_g1_i2.p1  ORF type:complete len:290 (-),score=63.27 TRINITY_DN2345_c2_g1_i2:505-1308(-)
MKQTISTAAFGSAHSAWPFASASNALTGPHAECVFPSYVNPVRATCCIDDTTGALFTGGAVPMSLSDPYKSTPSSMVSSQLQPPPYVPPTQQTHYHNNTHQTTASSSISSAAWCRKRKALHEPHTSLPKPQQQHNYNKPHSSSLLSTPPKPVPSTKSTRRLKRVRHTEPLVLTEAYSFRIHFTQRSCSSSSSNNNNSHNSATTTVITGIRLDDTIAALKQAIEDHAAIPAQQQRLIYGGKQMADSRTLRDYAVPPGALLHLLQFTSI